MPVGWEETMELMEAIYKRRAVRSFKPSAVDDETLRKLLDAGVHAPSAVNRQPWTFVIIEGKDLLKDYSTRAKRFILDSLAPDSPFIQHRDILADPAFNIFYDARTLIVICAISNKPGDAEDCCLAAENLMLAALDFGLGTCPIGFARPWLNLPEVKDELGIPGVYSVVMPIIVGYPASANIPPVDRMAPEVIVRKRAAHTVDTV
jgi:nitroreductase